MWHMPRPFSVGLSPAELSLVLFADSLSCLLFRVAVGSPLDPTTPTNFGAPPPQRGNTPKLITCPVHRPSPAMTEPTPCIDTISSEIVEDGVDSAIPGVDAVEFLRSYVATCDAVAPGLTHALLGMQAHTARSCEAISLVLQDIDTAILNRAAEIGGSSCARAMAALAKAINAEVAQLNALFDQADTMVASGEEELEHAAGASVLLTMESLASLAHGLEGVIASPADVVTVYDYATASAETIVDGAACLRKACVNPLSVSVFGAGTDHYCFGESEAGGNIVYVKCQDFAGCQWDGLRCSDVRVHVAALEDVFGAVAVLPELHNSTCRPGLISGHYAVHCTSSIGAIQLSVATLAGFCPDVTIEVCAGSVAAGRHVRSIVAPFRDEIGAMPSGFTLSTDAKLLAVADMDASQLVVYDFETFEQVRVINPDEQLDKPIILNTTVDNTILVAEHIRCAIREVTWDGKFVRFIGLDVFDTSVYIVTSNSEYIATAKGNERTESHRVLLFDYASGELVRSFGSFGQGVGRLGSCTGIRFSRDGKHLWLMEFTNSRLSQYTMDGEHVQSFGEDVLTRAGDFEFTASGDIVVTDFTNGKVHLFSQRGEYIRRLGEQGSADGSFFNPEAVFVYKDKYYILDVVESEQVPRIQVFE